MLIKNQENDEVDQVTEALRDTKLLKAPDGTAAIMMKNIGS